MWRPSRLCKRGLMLGRAAILMAFFALGSMDAQAQYNVFAWFSFDEGKLDSKAIPLGPLPGQRVFIMPYGQVPSPPRGFKDNVAANENGPYGLMLRTKTGAVSEEYITGLASNIILERHRLGAKGRALFQADFYFPPAPYPVPSVAVLAMEPMKPNQESPTSFYRFGITQNKYVYFSHVVTGEKEARVYKTDTSFLPKIPRGTWHRFAIIVEGQDTIRCYVDGHEPSYSPIKDSTMKNMQVGVMLADGTNQYDAFIDNLSIQWTNEDVPLPDSPWAHTWTGSAPVRLTQTAPVRSTTPSAAATPGSTSAATGPVEWFDVETGWKQAVDQQKPMLVYFLAPRLAATAQLDQMITGSPDAQAFLRQHSCVKVDVNQLQGGTYAAQFNIFKVPTLMVFDQQGKEKVRAVFNRNDTWATMEEKLKQP